MTPKEKALELVEKYLKLDIEIGGQYDGYLTMKMYDAKQCALIAVDEIIEATKTEIDRPDYNGVVLDKYWQEVKTELENL